MEPLTQGLLGAAVGQAAFARKLGPRALRWGAVVGMLPDLDIVAAPLHGGFGELLYHRGTTHALWFGPVVGPLLGLALWRARDGRPDTRAAWLGLCTLALFTHPLLDVFTPYGTQLLAPFSRARFAWNAVGIIDPLYTAVLAAGVLAGVLWRAPRHRALQRRAGWAALMLSTAYLAYGLSLNAAAESGVRQALARDGIAPTQVRVYPTLLQPWLRRFVARAPDRVLVGLHTGLRPGALWFAEFTPTPPDPRVDALRATWEGALFEWFAMGETTARVRPRPGGSVVELEDLRYGLPGLAPDRGLWGVRAAYDTAGRRVGPVERYALRRDALAAPVFRLLWSATRGDFSTLPRAAP